MVAQKLEGEVAASDMALRCPKRCRSDSFHSRTLAAKGYGYDNSNGSARTAVPLVTYSPPSRCLQSVIREPC